MEVPNLFPTAFQRWNISASCVRIKCKKYQGLKGMDAIHLATAIYFKCDIFLTNDSQLHQVSEANVVLVDNL